MDRNGSDELGTAMTRLRISLRGAVQGVGFRPFIYRLATELRLSGWVNNTPQGVILEVEGEPSVLAAFLMRLPAEKPPRSSIQSLEPVWLDPLGYHGFAIRASESGGPKCAVVLPDIATCPDCLKEIHDPQNRRYLYPFTNCTNCGPRYSIIEALPYDRPNTSMKRFVMCATCLSEYENPLDRRFHAQPNACPECGPHLELWTPQGQSLAHHDPALQAAVAAIRGGQILALKGLGGFHLMVNARSEAALRRLRKLKRREEKPFALMLPSLEMTRGLCEVDACEERLLTSPESPIVLLRRRGVISNLIAPGNPYLGVMLPYTPLHHLLMAELGGPIVATSGNLSDEPICIEEHEALERLGSIADLFLVHNRPIVRHVDDSIVRVLLGREQVLRRARGYAPLPLPMPTGASQDGRPLVPEGQRAGMFGVHALACSSSSETLKTGHQLPRDQQTEPCRLPRLLAVGAHLKNSLAVTTGDQVVVSQHIGDLETAEAFAAFQRVASDLQRLYETKVEQIVADLHPDYLSTKHALQTGLPVRQVQHHLAHVLACMAENELTPPVLGISWDGTGYGLDGTIWGGEFLLVKDGDFKRVAHLRPFRLAGAAQAVKEPRRVALGLLYEMFGEAVFEMTHLAPVQAFSADELRVLKKMLAQHLNTPVTTSAGRLFDGVASLVGLHQKLRFEGQGAMGLEFALEGISSDQHYEFPVLSPPSPPATRGDRAGERGDRDLKGGSWMVDWAPAVSQVLEDVKQGQSVGDISARFHNGLVEAMIAVARVVQVQKVALTGGCFQNKYMTQRAVGRLAEAGFKPYWHQRVPPNDGGIALGQVAALWYLNKTI